MPDLSNRFRPPLLVWRRRFPLPCEYHWPNARFDGAARVVSALRGPSDGAAAAPAVM